MLISNQVGSCPFCGAPIYQYLGTANSKSSSSGSLTFSTPVNVSYTCRCRFSKLTDQSYQLKYQVEKLKHKNLELQIELLKKHLRRPLDEGYTSSRWLDEASDLLNQLEEEE